MPTQMQQTSALSTPKVSIVIPVYNGANYLREALLSAISQTYGNKEILVIDDGSNDDGATERIAKEFEGQVTYIWKPNGGVATALNRGIEEMTGDYFSWLSHDDIYGASKIASQIAMLEAQPDIRSCIAYGDFATFTDSPSRATRASLPAPSPEQFRYFITTQNSLHGCTLLIPRQAFKEHGLFDSSLRTTQDYDLWFRMAATWRFIHQPEILVRARLHPEQGSHQLSDIVLDECNALLASFVEQLNEEEVRQGLTYSTTEGYHHLASNLTRRGFLLAGERALQLAGTVDPNSIEKSPLIWQRQIAQLTERVAFLDAQCCERQRMLDEVYSSRSWRLTASLRKANEFLKKLRW